MAQNLYQWTFSPLSPPCKAYEIFGHTGVECQLGSVVRSPEQVNYGFRNSQKKFQNPQNLFGQQTSPPGFANNQRVSQKSDLELLIENFELDNIRHNQEFKVKAGILNDSLNRLSANVDSLSTHNKMLETQIPQVAQQVTSSPQPSGVFPSQTETNPKSPINAITPRDGKQLEDPVVETKKIEVEVESEKPQSEKVVVESGKPHISPPYEPKIHFPQGFDESKLDEQFRKSIAIIQSKLSSKLKDPESFPIPCDIGSKTIERTTCDLGENISLMPLSLSERLGIG